jgi:predicted adenine nucleotide alpha hydrolase (AANH) superfamily ATPase
VAADTRILVHVCCGPCYLAIAGALEEEGLEPIGYFYNPNVHPLIEFRRRLKAARLAARATKREMLYDPAYGLKMFLERVETTSGRRCAACYRLRLTEAARRAVSEGLERFTTTLMASPHQDLALIETVGTEAAREADVEFVARNWRGLHDAGTRLAKKMSLYRQQYCGCIFSEYERFAGTRLHLLDDDPAPEPGGPSTTDES